MVDFPAYVRLPEGKFAIFPWKVTETQYLEDHPRTCKYLVTPIYKPWKGHL